MEQKGREKNRSRKALLVEYRESRFRKQQKNRQTHNRKTQIKYKMKISKRAQPTGSVMSLVNAG